MQDQSYIPVLIAIGCFVMFAMAMAVIFFALRHQRKMHEHEKRIQQMESDRQIALFKTSIEAEERQKEIIARNIHDSISPVLLTLKFSLTRHQSDFQNNVFSHEKLDGDKKTLDQLSRDIRAICHDLTPAVLNDLGLLMALEEHIDRINRSGQISAALLKDGLSHDLASLPKVDQVNIYRVCQELMNNILKHSGCNELSLTSRSDTNKLYLDFRYNGNGITDSDIEKLSTRGLGLNSLRSRVLILNARLNYIKTDNGFGIRFHIPLAA